MPPEKIYWNKLLRKEKEREMKATIVWALCPSHSSRHSDIAFSNSLIKFRLFWVAVARSHWLVISARWPPIGRRPPLLFLGKGKSPPLAQDEIAASMFTAFDWQKFSISLFIRVARLAAESAGGDLNSCWLSGETCGAGRGELRRTDAEKIKVFSFSLSLSFPNAHIPPELSRGWWRSFFHLFWLERSSCLFSFFLFLSNADIPPEVRQVL